MDEGASTPTSTPAMPPAVTNLVVVHSRIRNGYQRGLLLELVKLSKGEMARSHRRRAQHIIRQLGKAGVLAYKRAEPVAEATEVPEVVAAK